VKQSFASGRSGVYALLMQVEVNALGVNLR